MGCSQKIFYNLPVSDLQPTASEWRVSKICSRLTRVPLNITISSGIDHITVSDIVQTLHMGVGLKSCPLTGT